jgi:signal transduction histidine kinase/ActR/RegA family two-component response regulator
MRVHRTKLYAIAGRILVALLLVLVCFQAMGFSMGTVRNTLALDQIKGLDIVFPREYLRAALLVSLLSVWVLVGLFYYLNRYTKRYYFTVWTAAWLFYALWLTLGITVPNPSPFSLAAVLRQWCVSISAVFLLWGSLLFLGLQFRQSLLGLFMAFLLTWGLVGRFLVEDPFQVQLPIFILTGLSSTFAGLSFYRLRKDRPFVAVGLLFMGFFLWGIYLVSYPFSQKYATLFNAGFLFSAVLQLFIAVSMIVLVLEEARHINRMAEEKIRSIDSDRRELQLKVLSTEERCRSLFSQAKVREELQVAYDRLRETHQSVVQQERLRALGQMASGIAHDINNALSPIMTFSEMLLLKESNVSANGRKQLDHIRTSADDIAHIVCRLSEFYRRREHADLLQFVAVPELVHQVLELTSPCWHDIPESRGISIEVDSHFEENLPELWCNESELREALTNIILNAVDAMPQGGTINITGKVAETSAESGGKPSRLVLEIKDNGTGMDEATRQRCFEPFFSTKLERGGSGLGLAMVYGTMERHGGHVEVESELKKGTTMRLTFLLRHPITVPTPAVPKSSAPIGASLRVLCIDDEPLLRELLREILEFHNHRVEVADGGQAGLDLFNKEKAEGRPFDVVVTDLGMPGVNGNQVAADVKRIAPETAVILVTGWGSMLDKQTEESIKADALLSKPPKMQQLVETIARLKGGPGPKPSLVAAQSEAVPA